MITSLELFYFGDFCAFFVSHLSAAMFFEKTKNKISKKKYDNKYFCAIKFFRRLWSDVVFLIFFPKLFSENQIWTFLKCLKSISKKKF